MALNTQTTINTAATTGLNKTYIDRDLLAYARTQFIHAKYGQKRKIPPHNGKTVEFRRWNKFDPSLAIGGLTEGVTPSGQELGQTRIEATVKQYGAYVTISDLLDKTAIDDAMDDSVELLGEQIGTVIEWVTRDAMNAGTTVQYADGVANRLAITPAKKLTVAEVRKAVRTLKKNKVRWFTDVDGKRRGKHLLCICSPDATFDLWTDSDWKEVSKYSNAEAIYDGEIGKMYGVVFIESTEAKIFTPCIVNAVNAATSSSADFVLKNEPSAAGVAYLVSGAKLYINGTEYTVSSYDASTKTVTLSSSVSLTKDHVVCSADAGAIDATTKVGADVHSALVFGRDSYGTIDIGSSGAIRSYVKGFGSAGTEDPLNQRATVGAKVPAYTAKVVDDTWIVRIEHGVSA